MDAINEKDRISAKHLFLKYKNTPNEWTKEFVKNKLVDQILIYKNGPNKYKSKVKGWIIAQDGNNYACLIELDKVTDVGKLRDLDIYEVQAEYEVVKMNFFAIFQELQRYDYKGEGLPGMSEVI
jgi:hypothetical protein